MNREIGALTGLRGIAAIWVLALHVCTSMRAVGGDAYAIAKYIGAAGYLGVDVFFVLSGFVLALNYSEANALRSPSTYGCFLWKRLARIYPVHIAALVLFCVFLLATIAFALPYSGWRRLTIPSLLQHLTLTHAWFLPITKSWNVVSWSISAEWAAYLAFPLIALMAARFRSVGWACAMILALFCALASNVHYGFNEKSTMAYALARIGTEFPAGVLLHRIWTLAGRRTSEVFDWLALVAFAVLVIGSSLLSRAGPLLPLTVMPIVATVLVYSLAASESFMSRFLSSATMQHLGRVSYAFYMVHAIWLSLAATILLKFDLYVRKAPAIIIILSAVLVAYACAYWFYRSIEEPTRKAMIRMLAAPQEAEPQPMRDLRGQKVPAEI